MAKIYTRSGDKTQTGVFGGERVSKNDARIECLGTVDEVNSTIGLFRAKLGLEHPWQRNLHRIQKDLMDMMSHIATPSTCSKENKTDKPIDGSQFCEQWIDEVEARLDSESDYFLLPGGTELSALTHVIRTQMRRAERRLVDLYEVDPDSIEPYVFAYINRLSDLFFTLSRALMQAEGVEEERWKLFRYKS